MTTRTKTGEAGPVASEGTTGSASAARARHRHTVEDVRLNDPGTMPQELLNACECLAHYHTCHTSDKITRFGSKDDPDVPEIIVVSDPEWKAKLRDFLKSEFPG